MIRPTTLTGAKDILTQYMGDEYYIIYTVLEGTTGYWLVKIMDVEGCVIHNDHSKYMNKHSKDWEYWDFKSPIPIAYIPESIMPRLINENFVVRSMADKEWRVQVALGTAPTYRPYLIVGDVV